MLFALGTLSDIVNARGMDEKDKTRMLPDRVELIAGARDSKSSSQPSDPAWQ